MEYCSQIGQDKAVVSFFNDKKDLYFIDIGAHNGKSLSNTFVLEKYYNWNGICSEPLPRNFKLLKACRNVICDDNAVFSESGLSLEFSDSNLTSGISEYIDSEYGIDKNANAPKIIVKTITLQELLDKYKAPKTIHYFSLDTEGTELEILKSVDLNIYKFLYINLEHNYIEPRRTEMRTLLTNNGYLYKGPNKFDDDYIHESTIIGNYYYQRDYTKPIIIKRTNNNKFSVSSPYWKDDIGTFENGFITWKRLGKGKISFTNIKYESKSVWHRDTREGKNILFIGANNMAEIKVYAQRYKNGIFIEAIPDVYEKTKKNLEMANDTWNTNFIAINKLVTSKINEKYDFNIFSNGGASSSIYEANSVEWKWNTVKQTHKITLISTTIDHLIKENNWDKKKFDVVLDVQGAELEVLKGFGKDNINNIINMKVEVSTKEFYKGGVLFKDLNAFLVENGLKLTAPPKSSHCDVNYVRR